MTASGPERPSSASTDELAAALGVEITDEGKARARDKMDRAARARTPERRDALRAKVGLPPKSSAA